MTTPKKRHSPTPEPPPGRRRRFGHVVARAAGIARTAAANGASLIAHVPGTVRAATARAHDTTSMLQTLPDSTLRWLAATSVGLSAGLRIARAPRIVVAAGAVPALIVGAAIALRPVEPPVLADPVATPAGDPPA